MTMQSPKEHGYRSRMPVQLLQFCLDMGLIDHFSVEGDRVWIRQGLRTRSYDAVTARHVLDEMLAYAPTLRQMAYPDSRQDRSN
jgi:hypothetical protein